MKFDKDKRNCDVQHNFIIIAHWLMLRLLFSFTQVHVFWIIFPISQQAVALAPNKRTSECCFFFPLVFSPNSHFTHALHLFLMNCGNIANVSITMQSIDKIRFCLCPEFYNPPFDSFCNRTNGNVFELSLNEWM